jgi:hypothetical protein
MNARLLGHFKKPALQRGEPTRQRVRPSSSSLAAVIDNLSLPLA